MPVTQTIDVNKCGKTEPTHPCDPPTPCNPREDPEGECSPFLCFERLKNPESPDHLTRCRPGVSIGVRACAKIPKPHPSDPPPPCSTLENKKRPCEEPPLCWEKMKNPDLKKIRRVICTNSKGEIVEKEVIGR